ncbi:hypothetical protein [Streptococcus merionis]|nr:hypothetical protein [Streptococcus merionis]
MRSQSATAIRVLILKKTEILFGLNQCCHRNRAEGGETTSFLIA